MKSLEERIDFLEKRAVEFEKSDEDLSELIDEYQRHVQRSITELSGHLMEAVRPMIRKLIQEELNRGKG